MADLKVVYAPGKRPPQGKAVSEWWHTLPDWRKEYRQCSQPPQKDVAVHFVINNKECAK